MSNPAFPSCPQCGHHLATFPAACGNCGLMFIPPQAPCPKCNNPLGEGHTIECPRPPKTIFACPLCNGKRHRKSGDTWTECAWRQWENEIADGQREHTPENIEAFAKWTAAHPGMMAGSTDAERIIRNRLKGRY